MGDLISVEKLAAKLDIPDKVLRTRTREGEWVRRRYPVSQWAVWDREGELVGFDIPEPICRKLGLSPSESASAGDWFARLLS